MKTQYCRITMLAMALAIGIFLTGCSTTSGTGASRITPQRVQAVARLAAFGSATGFLISHPEYRPEVEKARSILVSLTMGEQWDIEQLAQAFRDAGFKQLNSQEGILAVEGAIALIDLTTGQTVDLKSNEYAKAAILGALAGVNAALAQQPTHSQASNP